MSTPRAPARAARAAPLALALLLLPVLHALPEGLAQSTGGTPGGSPEAAPAAPAGVGASIPVHGDEAEYQWAPQGAAQVRLKVRWVGTEDAIDRWGRALTVDVAEVTLGGSGGFRYAFAGGAHVPLFVDQDAALPGASGRVVARQHVPGLGYLQDDFCLVRAGWQGVPFARVAQAPLADLCPAAAYRADRLEDRGEEVVRGVVVRRFVLMDGARPQGTVWLAAGIPFPLAMSTCVADAFRPCEADALGADGATLVSYRRGRGAPLLPAGAAPSGPEGRPAAEFRPYADGPADGGAGKLTYETALETLESHEDMGAFRAWRRDHPGALPSMARHAVLAQGHDALTREEWWIRWVASDGTAWDTVVELGAHCNLVGRPPGPAGEMVVCPPAAYGEATDCACHPPSLPGRSITFAAAVRRFGAEDADGRHGGVAAYGFALALHGPDGPPGVVEVESAGRAGSQASRVARYDMQTGALWEETLVLGPRRGAPVATEPAAAYSLRAPLGPSTGEGGELPVAVSLAVGAGVLALVAVAARALRLPALGVALYSRLARRDLGEHPRRARILDVVRDRPGATLGDREREAGFGGGALRHHVEALVKGGYLARVRTGSVLRHFLPGTMDPGRMQETAILLSDTAEARVLRIVASRPGIHAADLARELGVTPVAVHYAVKSLAGKGMVREERVGRRVLLFPRDD